MPEPEVTETSSVPATGSQLMSDTFPPSTADTSKFDVNNLVDGKYNIDVKTSTIAWNAEKAAGSHNGTVALGSGSITVKGKTISEGSVSADMKTLKVIDLKDAAMNEKLVTHLKSADFFDVVKYPTVKVTFKKVAFLKTPQNDALTNIVADITIKGVTKTVELEGAMVVKNATGFKVMGSIGLNQKDFGLVSTTLDKALIKDQFTMDVDLAFVTAK